MAGRIGPIEVLVYNAGLIRRDTVGQLSTAEHQHAWAVNVVGAILHVQPRQDWEREVLLTG